VEAASFLAADMKFEGVTVAFSWPSEGLALSYPADGDQAQISVERNSLVNLLKAIRRTPGVNHIHVVAHSMGGRVVTGAVKWLAEQPQTVSGLLHDVVFAAPDVNSTTFRDSIVNLAKLSHRVTLYASSYDQALICSNYLYRGQRAGQAGDTIVVDARIETVDVTNAEEQSSWRWLKDNWLY